MVGLCGMSDMRDVEAAMLEGDEAATTAWGVYTRRIAGYIGRYIAILGGVDCVSFTAGVGENSMAVRRDVLSGLAPLGLVYDPARNAVRSREARTISTDDSPVAIFVIPTNEELQMAREVKAVIAG